MLDGTKPYQYAIWRVVPSADRGECLNAGVVLVCRPFLGAKVHLDVNCLKAMAPTLDLDDVALHLDLLTRIAAGDGAAGPIADLSATERFHWLTSPANTIVQPSPVHSGITANPQETLDHLFKPLVLRPSASALP